MEVVVIYETMIEGNSFFLVVIFFNVVTDFVDLWPDMTLGINGVIVRESLYTVSI